MHFSTTSPALFGRIWVLDQCWTDSPLVIAPASSAAPPQGGLALKRACPTVRCCDDDLRSRRPGRAPSRWRAAAGILFSRPKAGVRLKIWRGRRAPPPRCNGGVDVKVGSETMKSAHSLPHSITRRVFDQMRFARAVAPVEWPHGCAVALWGF